MNIYKEFIYKQLEWLSERYEEDGDDGYYTRRFCDWVKVNMDDLTDDIYNCSDLFNEIQEKINEIAEDTYERSMEMANKTEYMFHDEKTSGTLTGFNLDDMIDYLAEDHVDSVRLAKKFKNAEDSEKIDFIKSKGYKIFTNM